MMIRLTNQWLFSLALLFTVPAFNIAIAAPAPKGDTVDTRQQKEIIDTVASHFERDYVFANVASQMSDYLYERYENGAYEEVISLEAFVDSLTVDMRSISKDDHIRIYYRPDEYFRQDESADWSDAGWKTSLAQDEYFNFDFVKAERLLGNIGYLRFNQFRDAEEAGPTAIAALNFLAHCDALIIDLRSNGGGEPNMIQLISSYFFDEPRHLNSFYIRRADSTQEFWTHAEVLGPRMSNMDIFIIVSRHTFSAAEEFAYNLKHMGRATLIGGVTGGGAHHSEFVKVEPLNIEIKVPYARAINPITGTNWEGVGVEPHIKASWSKSYDVAYLEAAKSARAKTTNKFKEARLDWVILGLQAKLNPVTVDEEILNEYVGRYGDYAVYVADGVLHVQEGDYKPVELKPLCDTIFQWGDLDYLRVEFEVDQNNSLTRLNALDIDDGTVFLGERSE